METLKSYGKITLLVLLFICTVSISTSITVFTLMEQYRHNYKTFISDYDMVRIKVTDTKTIDYKIKELYEDSETYKIIDSNDTYHIVYKEDCQFFGKVK